jgi:hypothetical protein
MKNCPKCRVETRNDAEWCWFCGYAFEDGATDTQPPPPDTPSPHAEPVQKDVDA